ncbi:MarR family winged helix-turn-helix transcriptional regulator [Corynebacterium ammoniagenes]|uniref:HTH marR-type domain-containing protein n=2 Tax=Corynebacterium ammoniagenes TaxID=1697 RepID=A0AAV5G6G6_CORAM|nr:MarR family transcriptional regulator [Corynebacterium ammoniagenes]NMF31863.1 MarR family transcriptional regulator [Corynebacterium ammoniagenes]GJN41900.1 hypothetical protein CAT723_03790 [Corynebacterium ammoniagenes]
MKARSMAATSFDSIAEGHRQWEKHNSLESADGLATLTTAVRMAEILVQGAEDVLKPFGITFGHFELLTMLVYSRRGGLPMSKIGARLQLAPASLTHNVSKLEDAGLVERSRDPKDKRSTLVSITDQGIALSGAASPAIDDYFANLPMDKADQDAVRRIGAALRSQAGDKVDKTF